MPSTPVVWETSCPCLAPQLPERLGSFPLGVYCRLPGGKVRIPSRDELARFCTSGHHYDCPLYQEGRRAETIVTGLA